MNFFGIRRKGNNSDSNINGALSGLGDRIKTRQSEVRSAKQARFEQNSATLVDFNAQVQEHIAPLGISDYKMEEASWLQFDNLSKMPLYHTTYNFKQEVRRIWLGGDMKLYTKLQVNEWSPASLDDIMRTTPPENFKAQLANMLSTINLRLPGLLEKG